MDQGAVQEITKLAQLDARGRTVELEDGETYATQNLHHIPKYDPMQTAIVVSTLTSFVDFIDLNIDAVDFADYFVEITDQENIRLLSNIKRKDKQRIVPVVASLGDFPKFPFDQFMDIETFVIRLGSLFCHTGNLARLIEYTGKVSVDDGVTLEDDGITQKATLKSGLSGAIKEGRAAPRIVELIPFRTFREIEQPAGSFLFRMKKGNGGVSCALFEADGGAWKIEAVQTIKKWLAEKLPANAELTVIA